MLTLMYNMTPRRGAGGYSVPLQDIHNLPSDRDGTDSYSSSTHCCVPGECLRGKQPIRYDQIQNAIKVTCNNDNCTSGNFMHRECFDQWEQSVLTYLKNCGRARSWSDRQRQQNLWTKKGYDLAYKACSCSCGSGHLRKDLDWNATLVTGLVKEDDMTKKKKKKNSKSKPTKPTLSISALHNNTSNLGLTSLTSVGDGRGRTGSLSSSNGSASLPDSGLSVSPIHTLSSSGPKRKIRFDQIGDSRSVSAMNGSGIFTRRQDFSSFNSLPRHKLNSYHIKMEDEGNHGNDDTRCFILSTLAAHNSPRVVCLLCSSTLPVYDRYPLVDGTFFLSPRQHSKHCFEAKYEGKTQYLSVVCMDCLEGTAPGRRIKCRFCATPWDGSSLVLGTMYSYDVFAAQACCTERYKCNNCQKSLASSFQKMPFYSDYSHDIMCSQCTVQDFHFVKSLAFCFARDIP